MTDIDDSDWALKIGSKERLLKIEQNMDDSIADIQKILSEWILEASSLKNQFNDIQIRLAKQEALMFGLNKKLCEGVTNDKEDNV